MQLITMDFETYWATDYSLSNKSMTTQKYILDDRFKAHGCGIKIGTNKATWVTARLLPAVFAHINWDDAVMVGHNLTFDASILAWRFGIRPARYIDTLALARAQIGANMVKHGLDALGQQFFGHGKPEGLYATRGVYTLPPEVEATLGRYCVDDCEKTYNVLKLLLPGMTKTELRAMDWCSRTFTNPRFVIDTQRLGDYLVELKDRKQRALTKAGLTDRTMLGSTELFCAALERFGVEVPMKDSPKRKDAGGNAIRVPALAKTDEGLTDLLDHPDVDVQALVAARLEIKSTNEETKTAAYLKSAEYGSWPVDIKYAGAMNTQRFSGSSGGGGNPQNLGQGSPVRYAICAPEGHKVMAADLSQIEARITLQLAIYHYLWNRTTRDPLVCREQEALDTMRDGGDVYCWFGAMIYGHPIAKATHPVERQVSKAAVLGLGFGMGWRRFLAHCREKSVPMTEEMAKHIVKLYRKTFPNVVKSWKATLCMLVDQLNGQSIPAFRRILDPDKARNLANTAVIVVPGLDPIFKKVALQLPNGQYLKYPDLQCKTAGSKTEWWYINRGKKNYIHPGKVFENVVQSLAGIIMREQLVRLLDVGVQAELSVHDELVTLVEDNEEELARVGQLLDQEMTRTVEWMPELPVATERHTGSNYGECK